MDMTRAVPERRKIELGLLENFVGMLLRAAYNEAFEDFARLLGSDTLKPGFFTVLTLVALNPGITQVEIGREARRDKSSVTKALRQMEDEGLIRRVRLEDDRRSYASYLTHEGAKLHRRMEIKAREHIAHLDAVIGVERKRVLVETLNDLIADLPPSAEESAGGTRAS
ncbi:MarR family winged helix-turn-helix transcriptional regulator [Tranquillimonas alkanivorans]|nr:MarR family transcriptional regulator [Tranquillimonas alkanivorans]